jgi:hypothetical protein
MTTSATAFLFLTFVAVMTYLWFEHTRVTGVANVKPDPDVLDMEVSASAVPGDRVGPGATGNSGWYDTPANLVSGV